MVLRTLRHMEGHSTLLSTPILTTDDPGLWPDDDDLVYRWQRAVLCRIDDEYGCDEIVDMDRNFPYGNLEPVYCGLPEHDPFTNRCWDHTPGNLTSGHM